MMAQQPQIWQGTVWTGLTNEDGERLCPEVLPWADPYIAALVDKHRWQAVLFALQPEVEDEDEAFWDDESCEDPVPPIPTAGAGMPKDESPLNLSWLTLTSLPGEDEEPTEEYRAQGDRLIDAFAEEVALRRARGDLA